MFSRFVTVILIVILGQCHGQETPAEKNGEAVLSIQMTMAEFSPVEQQWRDSMAWHASIHCKQARDNCKAEDKQIRYEDVVIMDTTEVDSGNAIEVIFHIRNRYDHTMAGMTSQQVRTFFLKFESDVENDFYGNQMNLVAPGEAGMEAWLIAVIVISCVVGVALIITVAVLASNQMKYSKEKKKAEDLAQQHTHSVLLPGFASLPDGKTNPGYDSDNEKASTSAASGRSSSGVVREPPPAYFNHTVSPELVPEVLLVHTDHQDRDNENESRSSGHVSGGDYAVINHANENRKSASAASEDESVHL